MRQEVGGMTSQREQRREREGSRTLRVLDDATVRRLEQHWLQGWNDGDVDTIMAPFAPDVVFASPGISIVTGDPSQSTVVGSDALRAYLEHALRFSSGVRYSLQTTYVGTKSIVLVYECGVPDGPQKRGADLMRVDDDGRIVEWRCHY